MTLEEFARVIMSIKPALNNPDAFDKWMKNEEIEFKEPLIQEDIKRNHPQSVSYYVRLITFYVMLCYFPSSGKVVTFIFLSKLIFFCTLKINNLLLKWR